MNVSDQDLKHFKSLLLNDKFEEAKKILVQNKCDFKKELEVKTSSTLKDLPRDDLATFLIPDDVTRPGGQRLFALKATPNGDCLFNAISLLVRGNESAAMLLCLLVAGELYFNASFYANHHVFVDTIRSNSDLSLDTLFTVALTEAGADECLKNRSKTDAVKSEARVACTRGEWSSFLHILGIASVLSKQVQSIYPDVNFRFRSLIHRIVKPRASATNDPLGDEDQVNILWSRDGGFDNRPGVWYEPNHFVPVLTSEDEVADCPVKQENTAGTGRKTKQGTLFSFMKATPVAKTSSDTSCPTTGSSGSVPGKKLNAAAAKLSVDAKPDVKKSTESTKLKICHKWKDEFPWLIVREEDQAMLCSVCCDAPHVAGKTQFLTGCTSTKKETMQKHAASNGHLRAQTAVLAKQKPVRETAIAQSLAKGKKEQEERDQREVAVKITTAYFLAKEEIPFSKFQGLIDLQKKNGLDLTSTYANNKTCVEMVFILGKMLKERTAREINKSNYISVMADGATDAGGLENETVFCRYVLDGCPVNWLIGHKAVEHANAEGRKGGK
ncbi:uncharacterized protein LOC122961749 [Acropora millepora]|uniref:uncharacterized protein LOC122961749 n=1 Tax=Acropora millepora TaxID=45264 RepID=UPI001CF3F7F4|nr:uncharacterized protein LOC122961749 [Acropora millepora]